MLREMPQAADYRALPGRDNVNILDDGSATRVKIDLFPEYIRNLPEQKRELWDMVGRALCSNEVQGRVRAAARAGARAPVRRQTIATSACSRSRS